MTVRRYYRATSVDEMVAGSLAGWPSMLDEYKPYLHKRWNEGSTNIQQLFREIKAVGYRGRPGIVYAYLRPFKGKTAPPAVPAPPKVGHITSWIRRRPDNLDADEQLNLKEVRAACPHLDILRGHVEEFAKMLTGRHGERLDAWTPGSPLSAPTTCLTCTPSPTDSSAITPPSWPASHCRTPPALSRAPSARSNSGRESCSVEPTSTS
jgi:hypothetical protein